jgi:hypothetical protein
VPYQLKTAGTYTEVSVGGAITRIQHADLGAGGQKSREDKLRAFLQAAIDTRIPLVDLPPDEPTKKKDPGRTDFFWGDAAGIVQVNAARNDHLISRDTVVTVVFDGAGYNITQVRVPR